MLRGETLHYHIRWGTDWPELRQVGLYTVRAYLLWSVGDHEEIGETSDDEPASDSTQNQPDEKRSPCYDKHRHEDTTKAYRVSASGVLRVLLHGSEVHHG